ncbi:hypothetical protein QLL95_gp1261 [Cotonvirus japonicus]|uniref:Endonuclease/exonuclease/phosphatase family protein n=1 Tax=Cotonvirus japonicus TaxID=2811091 RepID=A0ABM7NRS6_9VIRU|nr:hypothetical protein QLL95_gp1261 [Cotonvirus japonicus]BCS82862.1 hypothetical protein [Cotonvirus japonicus]
MVKILSYNVFYKSMQTYPTYKNCEPIINDNVLKISYTKCLDNVSKFIEKHKPYDFIFIQEAANFMTLLSITPVLKSMNYVSDKFDLETIVTFYNKNLVLDNTNYKLVGYMADVNRPFHVLFFKGELCVINLHAGHKADIYNIDNYLVNCLIDNPFKKEFLQKLKTYDIIIGGDFNDNLNNGLTILTERFFNCPRQLYGFNRTPSCCNPNLNYLSDRNNAKFDHILSTIPTITSQIVQVPRASDHMPIIANIIKRIGYDFDGVLHNDVGISDREGQRHPYNLKGPYQPNHNIIKNITYNLSLGYEVYIITARQKNRLNFNTIINHLIKCQLNPEKITILFSNGQDKTKLLHEYKINSFYEDSYLRINELYNSYKKGLLSDLHNLYLVDPDDSSIKSINLM